MDSAARAVDLFSIFSTLVDSLIQVNGSQFQAVALGWLDNSLGPIALFVLIFRYLLHLDRRNWLIQYAAGYLTAKFLLLNYSTPSALLGGSSVVSFFHDIFKGLALQVDQRNLHDILAFLGSMFQGQEMPSITDPEKVIAWLGILTSSVILQAIVWVVTLAGLIGYGIGGTIGALFIPWFVFPSTRFITVRWLNFMLMTNAYRLVGAVYIKIFTGVLMVWFGQVWGPNHDLVTALALLAPMLVLIVVMVLLTFFIFHWTHDLFSGTLTAALSSSGAVKSGMILLR